MGKWVKRVVIFAIDCGNFLLAVRWRGFAVFLAAMLILAVAMLVMRDASSDKWLTMMSVFVAWALGMSAFRHWVRSRRKPRRRSGGSRRSRLTHCPATALSLGALLLPRKDRDAILGDLEERCAKGYYERFRWKRAILYWDLFGSVLRMRWQQILAFVVLFLKTG